MPAPTLSLPARPAEAHALAVAAELPGDRIACTTIGRGQAAVSLARDRPAACVTAWFLDLHQHNAAAAAWDPAPPNLVAPCTADLPPGPYDLVLVPLVKGSEAELSRDLLQQAFDSLALGGRLVTAVDNARDTWLREQLAASGETVRVRPADGVDAIAYVVEKTRDVPKRRDFTCRFKFRDHERLLEAISRPGVFAHRRIDPGARHLLNAVDVAPETRVLDMFSYSGGFALACAVSGRAASVLAVDTSAKATALVEANAALNGVATVTAETADAFEKLDALAAAGETFGMVILDPPKFARSRASRDDALRAYHRINRVACDLLEPGGILVTCSCSGSVGREDFLQMLAGVAQRSGRMLQLLEVRGAAADHPVSVSCLEGEYLKCVIARVA